MRGNNAIIWCACKFLVSDNSSQTNAKSSTNFAHSSAKFLLQLNHQLRWRFQIGKYLCPKSSSCNPTSPSLLWRAVRHFGEGRAGDLCVTVGADGQHPQRLTKNDSPMAYCSKVSPKRTASQRAQSLERFPMFQNSLCLIPNQIHPCCQAVVRAASFPQVWSCLYAQDRMVADLFQSCDFHQKMTFSNIVRKCFDNAGLLEAVGNVNPNHKIIFPLQS